MRVMAVLATKDMADPSMMGTVDQNTKDMADLKIVVTEEKATMATVAQPTMVMAALVLRVMVDPATQATAVPEKTVPQFADKFRPNQW